MKKLSGIKAVAFDVFGTLVEIHDKRRPYRELLNRIASLGHPTTADVRSMVMSNNVGLCGVAEMFGITPGMPVLAKLELDLYAELASIKIYDDVEGTLKALRNAGYKIGICSNLAAPYAAPIKLLLPFELDFYAWSFESGAVKPQPRIYEFLCNGLRCRPEEVLMVGDTFDADYIGPKKFGMHGYHLVRQSNPSVSESIASLGELLQLLPV